jgi:Putative transposase, YhgA-like
MPRLPSVAGKTVPAAAPSAPISHSQQKSSESDLLFNITLHQSDAFFYLLSYILRIWEHFAQSHPPPAKLPAILPNVLAQGKRPRKTSTRLEDLIELPPAVADILRPWQPTLAYHLLELAWISYDKIAGTPQGIRTLRGHLPAYRLHTEWFTPLATGYLCPPSESFGAARARHA